jgi:tetratricopeptide (TPR) repeat protein
MGSAPGNQKIEGSHNNQVGQGGTLVVVTVAPSPAAPTRHWNVPFPRNPNFKGRERELEELRRRLRVEGTAAPTQRHALTGLGGVGKTQTAVEYAHRYHAEHQSVFWVRADSTESLNEGFSDIARRVVPDIAKEAELARVVAGARDWLERHGDWLLVCDNADEPALLASFGLPTVPTGRILITSRSLDLEAVGISNTLELDVLPPTDALEFLLERTGKATAGSGERAAAAALSADLGRLPLALEQAAAFIRRHPGLTFMTYLATFRDSELDLLERQAAALGNYPHEVPRSVAKTWRVNFEALDAALPAAADLLRISAYMSPGPIPMQVVSAAAQELRSPPDGLVSASPDPIALAALIRPLAEYSLVRTDEDAQNYMVHRMVQAVQRRDLAALQRYWLGAAVRTLGRAFPGAQFANWPLCDRLLPHARALLQRIVDEDLRTSAAGRLLARVGSYLGERGDYALAEKFCRQALEIRRTALGHCHLDTAESSNDLAYLVQAQGRVPEAELLCREALDVRSTLLGHDDPATAECLNNVAYLLQAQGKLPEAESLYRQALETFHARLGDGDPETATGLNNLAAVLEAQGKVAEAESLHRRALEICRAALGENHPSTATSLNNLGSVLRVQGRLAEAEAVARDGLSVRKAALGDRHPETATSLSNLALVLEDQGKPLEAALLLGEATQILTERLGAEHPTTAKVRTYLARLSEKAERPAFGTSG